MEYDLVAEDINISQELASEIVCAADSPHSKSPIRRKLREFTK